MPRKFEVTINNPKMVITEENVKYTLEQFYCPSIIVKEIPCNPNADDRNKKVVEEIFNLVNIMGNDRSLALAFSRHIVTEHRTLIQSFFRMTQKIIYDYAKYGNCDSRNKGSLDWALEVSKINNYMPLI